MKIIYDILHTIKEYDNSISPTPLMRFSNLSSQSFDEYISELVNKNFIKILEKKEGRKKITLADKGFDFLREYKAIKNFIEDFGL